MSNELNCITVPDTAFHPPTCEIITIGSELLLGQIDDTNTTYLARELSRIGVAARFRTAAGDRPEDMENVIRQAIERCDMIITTGGLGPTEDDLTRQSVANVAGVELEFQQGLMDEIEEFFHRLGYKMQDNNRRQAFIPVGSQPIHNPVGTAPGFIIEIQERPVISLPGVPRELKYLLKHEVFSWIKERFNLTDHVILYRVLKVAGIGESMVDSIIGDLIIQGQNPEVGLLASPGEIKIRLTARAGDREEARSLIRPVEEEIRLRLREKIYGEGDETLEEVVEDLLGRHDLTLAILETFTGGLTALRLHQIFSNQLIGSVVIPGKTRLTEWSGKGEIKMSLETARGLACRVKEEWGADVGMSLLGFAEKMEKGYEINGYIAVAGKGIIKDFSWPMGGDLFLLQQRGAVICLNTLRLALIEAGKNVLNFNNKDYN